MYDKNITTKVRLGTKDAASRLADDEGITLSEFARLGIEEYVRNTLRTVLIERGFDEVNALSLLDCMGSDDVRGINDVGDISLAYRAVDGHVRGATMEEIEDALADVKVIVRSRESGDTVTMQNGKEIIDDNQVLIVAGWDKKLGVMVIA